MTKTIDIGIEIPDEDFEFFRRATIGNEQRVLRAIAKFSIIEMHKIGKKRKIKPRFVIYEKDDPIARMYDDWDDKVGSRARKAINLLAIRVIRNGHGTLDEILNKIDRDFENWKINNGGKNEKPKD